MNASFVLYHTDQYGFRNVVAIRGTKWYQAIIIDSPIRVIKKIPLIHEKHMKDRGDVRKAAKKFLKAGRNLGITSEAKKVLKRILAVGEVNEAY